MLVNCLFTLSLLAAVNCTHQDDKDPQNNSTHLVKERETHGPGFVSFERIEELVIHPQRLLNINKAILKNPSLLLSKMPSDLLAACLSAIEETTIKEPFKDDPLFNLAKNYAVILKSSQNLSITDDKKKDLTFPLIALILQIGVKILTEKDLLDVATGICVLSVKICDHENIATQLNAALTGPDVHVEKISQAGHSQWENAVLAFRKKNGEFIEHLQSHNLKLEEVAL